MLLRTGLPLLTMPGASRPKHIPRYEPDPLLTALTLTAGAYLVNFKELGISTWPLNGHFDNVRWRWHCSQRPLLQDSCLEREPRRRGQRMPSCLFLLCTLEV